MIRWDPPKEKIKVPQFLLPNEIMPEKAIGLWRQSAPGLYVSVGTERGFIGAALSRADALLLTDFNDWAVLYNRVTILLLKLCKTGSEYLDLKINSDKLLDILEKRPSQLTEAEISRLKSIISTAWWQELTRKSEQVSNETMQGSWFFDRSLFKPEVRYWENPNLYSKLRAMALKGNIQALRIDLSNPQQSYDLFTQIAEKKLSLAVLDISNAWDTNYLGGSGAYRLIRASQAVSHDNSILLTSWIDRYEYVGFTYRYLFSNYFSSENRLELLFRREYPLNLDEKFICPLL